MSLIYTIPHAIILVSMSQLFLPVVKVMQSCDVRPARLKVVPAPAC